MKFLLSLSIYLIIVIPVYGQSKTEIAWYKTYDGPVSGIDIPNAATLDNDFNLYIAGRSSGSGSGQDLLILKYARDGGRIDTIRYGQADVWEEAYSIVTDNQLNIFVSGVESPHGGSFHGIFQKYDASGDLIWSHKLPVIPVPVNGLQLGSESNIVIGFTETDTTASFIKLDSETGQDTVWANSYNTNRDYLELVDMAIDQNNNLYALAMGNFFCESDLPCVESSILKFNNEGEFEWEYSLENYRPEAIIVDSEENIFFVADQAILQKIDRSGNLIWENIIDFGFITHGITGIEVDRHGNVVICYWGRTDGTSFYYALEKQSPQGEVLWSNIYHYDETNFTVGSGLHIDADDNIYVTGHNQGLQVFKFTGQGELLWTEKKDFSTGVSYDGNWIFTNEYDEVFVAGNMANSSTGTNFLAMKINENIEVSTAPIRDEVPNKIALKQNYPNPFNPATTIEYEVIKQGEVSVRVYDQMGRFVRELVKSHHSPGMYSISFDGKNLASGIYYFRLQTSDEQHIGKAVLVK